MSRLLRAPLVFTALALFVACSAREPRDRSELRSDFDDNRVRTLVEVPLEGVIEIEVTGAQSGVVAFEVPISPREAWATLPRAYHEIGFRGAGVVDDDLRIFGQPDGVIRQGLGGRRLSAFMNCGQSPGGSNADVYRVTGGVLTLVRQGPDGHAVLEILVDAYASPREVSGRSVRCNSNGQLERLIANTTTLWALSNE